MHGNQDREKIRLQGSFGIKKAPLKRSLRNSVIYKNYFFLPFLALTLSLSDFPALNVGTVDAAILILSPVAGLRPLLAASFFVLNVPKPTRTTFSFFTRAPSIAPRVALRAASVLAAEKA